MATFYEIPRLLDAPFEDLLLKLYPATFLKWLYEVNLKNLAEGYAGALPQPEPPKRSNLDKSPNKPYLMQLLLAVLRDKAISQRFFETLPQATRQVIAALTWTRRETIAALEQTLGQQIATPNPDERQTYYEPFLLPPEHGFVVVVKAEQRRWSYSLERDKPKREDYWLLLPDAVRKTFKAFVPPPSDYDLLPLDKFPSGRVARYSCAEEAIADLRLVAEYIAQGHLKYTKSGQVAVPSLRILRQMTGGPEFFEDSDDSDLALLRTRLLAGGLAFVGEKERGTLLARPGEAEPVRGIVEKVLANASFLHEELLPHLAHSRNRWCKYSSKSVQDLAAFFGKLPADKWVSLENVRRYHVLRELLPSIFDLTTQSLEVRAFHSGDSWSRSIYICADNQFELLGEPLLKGFAFLLAAFGLAEVAYNPPEHSVYRLPKKRYLTPFDRLDYARLTPLGEFVFRRRDHFEITAAPPTRSPIILDESRLLVTCRNADQLTQLALEQFMEPLAPSRYRMTAKSFLGGCRSRDDIEDRIRLFRRVVSAAPPAMWEAFLERIRSRVAPLSLEADYIVLKISSDEEIRRLLASDPVLREIILKVEGLRIAVRQSDLKKLAKRLEQFGYLSPTAFLAL